MGEKENDKEGYWYKKYIQEQFSSSDKIQKVRGASLKLQAKEYKRRLKDLDNSADRLRLMQDRYIPREVFDRTMQQKDERYDRTHSEIKTIINELEKYKTKQEGSLRVILYLVSIGVAILIGLVVKTLVTGKGL